MGRRPKFNFSEYGHAAYQIKGNDACSNMVAIFCQQTLTRPQGEGGGWSKGQHIFSESSCILNFREWNLRKAIASTYSVLTDIGIMTSFIEVIWIKFEIGNHSKKRVMALFLLRIWLVHKLYWPFCVTCVLNFTLAQNYHIWQLLTIGHDYPATPSPTLTPRRGQRSNI